MHAQYIHVNTLRMLVARMNGTMVDNLSMLKLGFTTIIIQKFQKYELLTLWATFLINSYDLTRISGHFRGGENSLIHPKKATFTTTVLGVGNSTRVWAGNF